jgi:hypothetical protein
MFLLNFEEIYKKTLRNVVTFLTNNRSSFIKKRVEFAIKTTFFIFYKNFFYFFL